MSEQILERPTTAAPGAGVPGLTDQAAETRGTRNRTFLVVAGAVIAGLVLGGLFLFVMKPGASDEALAPVAPGSPAAAARSSAAAGAAAAGEVAEGTAAEGTAAQAGDAVPATTTTRLTSRDPFAPLVAKKPPAPAPAPAPAAAAPAGAAAPATVPTPATGGTISALSISPLGNAVTLKLDGKKYEVDEGEMFAKSYRLYDIFNESCAGFLYGDQNAVVCEGDSVAIG